MNFILLLLCTRTIIDELLTFFGKLSVFACFKNAIFYLLPLFGFPSQTFMTIIILLLVKFA